MGFDLALEFILSGKPRRVMELLTDSALIRKWSGGNGLVEQKIGGKFEMLDGWVSGKVLKVTENELAYTWKTVDDEEGHPETEVHYLLKADEAGTKVILRHTGIPNEKERESYRSGWTDFFFDPLEDFILMIDKS